jgi:RND family efflux transporter MFP subunit
MKNSLSSWLILFLVVAAAAGGGYWFGHRGAAEGKAAESSPETAGDEKPIASVEVRPIRRGTITELTTAYGTVVAPANEVRVLSVPFEARVTKVLASPGETVAANQDLIEIEGSAATLLALTEAKNSSTAAERDLKLVRDRYAQKLATNSDLYLAENTFRTAQARLQSLDQSGAAGPQKLKSQSQGVISKIDVQVGQIVPVGNPLIEVAAQNQIEVKIGVDPEDVKFLTPGQAISLRRVHDSAGAIAGKIRLIGQRVDPMTRLVDVLVSLPPGAKLMLDDFVAAQITKASAESLVVARDAVLPDDGGYTLYTMKDGKVKRRSVQVGLANDQELQIVGGGVAAGELAVVVGNYELQDGMAVEVQNATTPPSTAPSTEPGATK